MGLWKSELRSGVKVDVAVQCSPSLIVRTVSMDVKHTKTHSESQSSGAV